MYWTNSDFQIEYFLAGKCQTPDEAYRLLWIQREDREQALAVAQAGTKRLLAKKLRAEQELGSSDPLTVLEAEATILEIEAFAPSSQRATEGAQHELETITKLMDRLEPLRQFAHLPLPEAAQATQRAEWFAILKRRAENYLISGGTIPPDELDTMRSHPDFRAISAHIMAVSAGMREGSYDLTGMADWCAGLLSEVADG
jgi:hypothetical protein